VASKIGRVIISQERAMETRYGPIIGFCDDLVSKFLDRYGEWGYFESLFVASMLSPDAVVYDVGSYLGTFSFGLADCKPAFVVAVEANPVTFNNLKKNFECNADFNFQLINSALGQHEGFGKGKLIFPGNQGSFSMEINSDTDFSSDCIIGIPMRTLKSLREEFGRYHLLKLDVEGAEASIIRSDYDWIAKNKPIIWAECNDSQSSLGLFQLMNTLDVDIYFYRYSAFNPDNFNKQNERIFPVAFEAGLLAVPRGTPVECPSCALENGASCTRVNSVEALRQLLWLTPRWGKKDWSNLSRTELLALLSHMDLGENFQRYLGGEVLC